MQLSYKLSMMHYLRLTLPLLFLLCLANGQHARGQYFDEQMLLAGRMDGQWNTSTADLDGDGDEDILYVSRDNHKVYWISNKGGSFSGMHILPHNYFFPDQIEAADLDQDGDLDVVVNFEFSSVLAWFENTGKGNFTAAQAINSSAGMPSSFALHDLDADNRVDIVYTNTTNNEVAWHKNNGGSFTSAISIETSLGNPVYVTTGDVAGSSLPDVVFASKDIGLIGYIENLGSGSFATSSTISSNLDSAEYVKLFDLDGDTVLDVLAYGAQSDNLVWYENQGSGSFSSANNLTTSANGFGNAVFADVDSDSLKDVIYTSYDNDEVLWFKNQGSGNFGGKTLILNFLDGAHGLAAADFNGDTALDLALTAYLDDELHALIGQGNGIFTSNTIGASIDAPEKILLEDLDQDGDTDVLVSSQGQNYLQWFENTGYRQFSKPKTFKNLSQPSAIASGDLDNDGDVDIVAASYDQDEIVWFEQTSPGVFASKQVISSSGDADGPTTLAVADLFNDGNLDVLAGAENQNRALYYEGNGQGSFGSRKILHTSANGIKQIHAEDLDQNGLMDVVTVNPGSDVPYAHFGDTGRNMSQAFGIPGVYFALEMTATADFSGDGFPDVALVSAGDNMLTWVESDTSKLNPPGVNLYPTFETPVNTISNQENGATTVLSMDIDGDTTPDLIVGTAGKEELAYYLNLGGGSFGSRQVLRTSVTDPNDLRAEDMDGNLSKDLVYVDESGDYVAIEFNCEARAEIQDSLCFGDSLMVAGQMIGTTGQYDFTVNRTGGCDSTIALDLTVLSEVNARIARWDDTTILALPNAPNNNFQWLDESGNKIGPDNFLFSPGDTGNYRVIVFQEDSFCVDTSDLFLFEPSSLQKAQKGKLSVFPNPAHQEVAFTWESLSIERIRVVNSLGQSQWQSNSLPALQGQKSLSTASWPSGMYLLIVEDPEGRIRKKPFVVQH